MNVSVKCFATLSDADTCDFHGGRSHAIEAGATVDFLLKRLAIPEDDVKLIFVNGMQAEMGTRLSEGDRVAFAPAVGGM